MGSCRECRDYGLNCADGQRCTEVREGNFRKYGGIRLTSDGFDCALPVTIDSHSVCAYGCLYCFADNIVGHQAMHSLQVGRTSLKEIEGIFSGQSQGKKAALFRRALKYDRRNPGGFPTAVQLGGLCDPCDSIEQHSGWLLEFIELAIKYGQPVRISTKGAIFLMPEYFKAITKRPELFWVAFSIITPDDTLARRVEKGCPDATTRLKTMAKLSQAGVKTSLRMRPMVQGITDKNKGHITLIEKAAAAGARAISYEVAFYPGGLPKDKQPNWKRLNIVAGRDLKALYSTFGKMQACTRPAYTWTEDIMHKVREVAHANGMTVGVSDPVWKQLSDVGCCCGIRPEDPVFGNWEQENATNALVKARDGESKIIRLEDIIPPWAATAPLGDMVNLGAGPLVVQDKRTLTWADKLREIWNNPSKERSPVNYFQGAMVPHGQDEDGNLTYYYKGLQRQHKKSGWNV
jgi:DNA repair photolyase